MRTIVSADTPIVKGTLETADLAYKCRTARFSRPWVLNRRLSSSLIMLVVWVITSD